MIDRNSIDTKHIPREAEETKMGYILPPEDVRQEEAHKSIARLVKERSAELGLTPQEWLGLMLLRLSE